MGSMGTGAGVGVIGGDVGLGGTGVAVGLGEGVDLRRDEGF